MTTQAPTRLEPTLSPEILQGICPRDGGDIFHQPAEVGNVWICGQCSMLSHGSPTSRSAIWEALGE
jgi:hypothetical protein